MIRLLLQPLVCERFLTDARYREGHLRVVNALPERRVLGLHSPEIKQVAKLLTREGGEVSSCDMPFNEDFGQFGSDYLRLTQQVAESCTDHDLSAGSMVIGTSALAQYEIDGAVGMYSGIFNNPFMIWGRYKRGLFKTTLGVSFQFHHTQMDGAHAAKFLDLLQRDIEGLKV